MTVEPTTVVEGTPKPGLEMVSLPKERAERLQRLEAEEGYARRTLEKERDTWKAKHEALLATADSPDVDESEAKKTLLRSAKVSQEAEERLTRAQTLERKNDAMTLAYEMSVKYGVAINTLTEKFAECDSVAEMKAAGLELALATKSVVSSNAIDAGTGGATRGGVITREELARLQRSPEGIAELRRRMGEITEAFNKGQIK